MLRLCLTVTCAGSCMLALILLFTAFRIVAPSTSRPSRVLRVIPIMQKSQWRTSVLLIPVLMSLNIPYPAKEHFLLKFIAWNLCKGALFEKVMSCIDVKQKGQILPCISSSTVVFWLLDNVINSNKEQEDVQRTIALMTMMRRLQKHYCCSLLLFNLLQTFLLSSL